MRESIFANREPRVIYWYTGIVDFIQSIGWEFWLIGLPFVLLCLYVLYRVFKTYFITPGMTRREKFGALINYISYLILISVMIDIVKNAAGYNKKK